MLRIRLRRTGRKNQPFFQIVVIEKGAPPKGGRAKEVVGFLNPVTKESNVKKERVKYWMSVGAQPSDRVHNLLVDQGVIKEDKKAVHSIAKEEEKPEPEAKPEPDSGAEAESKTEPETIPVEDSEKGKSKPEQEEKEAEDAEKKDADAEAGEADEPEEEEESEEEEEEEEDKEEGLEE